jgi:dynein heavy chain
LINKDFEIENEDFTLKGMLDLKVNAFKDEIVAISTQATQEYGLREEIKKIDELYKVTMWDIEFDEKCDCFLLKDMTDVYQALDDSLSNINMILGSRFVKPLRQDAETWKQHIMTLGDMVDQWMDCQRKWRYLENIFKAADIKAALKEETKKFEGVDRFFKGLMT